MTVHVRPVTPENCPALVLNADFRPLSYYPLSIWCWQDAIKAVFLDRVNILSEYDTLRAQPELRDAPALRRVAEELCQTDALSRVHPVQCVPARPLHLPILRPEPPHAIVIPTPGDTCPEANPGADAYDFWCRDSGTWRIGGNRRAGKAGGGDSRSCGATLSTSRMACFELTHSGIRQTIKTVSVQHTA